MTTTQLAYLRHLADLEQVGHRIPIDIGPYAGVNLLVLFDVAAAQPGMPQACRTSVEHLTERMATIGVTEDMIISGDPHAAAAVMQQLRDRETAGQRATVTLGPYTAMLWIGMLQMVSQRPDLNTAQRRILHGFIDKLRPLFTGTPGEQIVNQGDPVPPS